MARTTLSCLLLSLPLVCSSGVRPLIVVGSSMRPTLEPGQLVLLHRDYYRLRALQRGDVVVFRWKGHTYVKRVYALGGDSIELLYTDGYCTPMEKTLEPKFYQLAKHSPIVKIRKRVVPPGSFFSLGDNLVASVDSRDLGPIPMSAIIGRVQSLWGSCLPERGIGDF